MRDILLIKGGPQVVEFDDSGPSIKLATGEVHDANIIIAVDGKESVPYLSSILPLLTTLPHQASSRVPVNSSSVSTTNPNHQ